MLIVVAVEETYLIIICNITSIFAIALYIIVTVRLRHNQLTGFNQFQRKFYRLNSNKFFDKLAVR